MVIVVIQFGYARMSPSSDYAWTISSTEESENSDALNDAKDDVDQLNTRTGAQTQAYDDKFFFLHSVKNKADIYTAENLLDMCHIETSIALDPEYPNLCVLDKEGVCTLPSTSIVVHFYEFHNISQWSCYLLSESVVEQKRNQLYTAMQTPEGQEKYGYWLSKDAVKRGYSTKAQSIWLVGAPLEGYDALSSKEDEQDEKYRDFFTGSDGAIDGVEETLLDFFDLYASTDGLFSYYPSPYLSSVSEGQIEEKWFSGWNVQNENSRLITTDLLFSMFSILFVLFWLYVHTKSLIIALAAMYMIFCSIPCSLLIYKAVYNIPFFSELHILVLYIVLGVGADDVFVLVDSWKQTANIYEGDISNGRDRELTHKRLQHCYEHTISTVFNTSFTTAAAFIATGFSPLMPIATFGWFAATCIVLNFIFVVSLMPPVVVISEMYCSRWFTCSVIGRMAVSKTDPEDEGICANSQIQDDKNRDSNVAINEDSKAVLGDSGSENHASSVESKGIAMVQNYNGGPVLGSPIDSPEGKMEPLSPSFTEGQLHNGDVEADGMSNKEPNETTSYTTQVLGSKSPIVDIYISVIEANVPLGNGKRVPIVAIILALGLFIFGVIGAMYGLQLRPPTEIEEWFPNKHMYNLARKSLLNDFLGADDSAYETVTFTFGIEGIDRGSFDIYKPDENRGDAKFDSNWNLAQPACQRAMVQMCDDIGTFECRSEACKPTKRVARENTTECFMKDFRVWAQSVHGEDTYNMSESRFYSAFMEFREEETQRYSVFSDWQEAIGFIGGELKFGSVIFTSTMDSRSSMQHKQEVVRRLDALVKKVKNYGECNECDCSSLMYTGEGAFVWMRSEEGIVKGFYQGLSIAFPVAFLVLLCATGNIIIATYAIMTVFFIVFGVLGFINYSMNWHLGIAESIAGIIIIGFSVDYTVHLGHMYNDAEPNGFHDRKSKFEMTSRVLLLTVIGGAITTIGAGVFMFPCQLIFFNKMAVLIVATILFSWVYALGFFMSLLYLVGPEGATGSIPVAVAKLRIYFEENRGVGEAKISPSSSDHGQKSSS